MDFSAYKSTPESLHYYQVFSAEVAIQKKLMMISAFFTILTNSFAIYMILRYSPPQIGVYKRYLLNVVFWSMLADLNLSVVVRPYMPYPCVALCSFGLISGWKDYRVQLISMVSRESWKKEEELGRLKGREIGRNFWAFLWVFDRTRICVVFWSFCADFFTSKW